MSKVSVALPLALLALGAGSVLLSYSPARVDDEGRYLAYAFALVHGAYSPPGHVFLWNGPGYPVALSPFVALGAPLVWPRLMNAVFSCLAALLVYRSARLLVSARAALVLAAVIGLYPAQLARMRLLYTEPLCTFLAAGWAYFALRSLREGGVRHELAAGVFLGGLALTKLLYGPVIMCLLALTAALWLWRRRPALARAARIAAVALACCVPWLWYTASLTGRVPYWGSPGGLSFYWMSTPFEGELGDWHHPRLVFDDEALRRHHGELLAELMGRTRGDQGFDEILNIATPESEARLWRAGLENVASSPGKFARNCAANLGRLFFDAPYSFDRRPLLRQLINLYALPNLLILALCLGGAVVAWRCRRWSSGVWLLYVFLLLTVGGQTVLSGEARMMIPNIPVLLLGGLPLIAWLEARRSAVTGESSPQPVGEPQSLPAPSRPPARRKRHQAS